MEQLELALLSAFSKMKKVSSYNTKERTITLDNYILLSTIIEEGKYNFNKGYKTISTSKLADILEMSKPALAKETRKLLEMGLIKKDNSLSDLRVSYISITKKGEKAMKSRKNIFYAAPNKIVNNIGKKDSEKLVILLNKVNDIMNNEIIKEGI